MFPEVHSNEFFCINSICIKIFLAPLRELLIFGLGLIRTCKLYNWAASVLQTCCIKDEVGRNLRSLRSQRVN